MISQYVEECRVVLRNLDVDIVDAEPDQRIS